jgi:sugar-specific transcriptional regulator TrmB
MGCGMGREPGNDLVHHLQCIGFTQYEAKVYIALTRAGALNGNEISHASGVPSSKTYETVRKLVAKGAIAAYAEETGTKYVALPPAQVIERYRDGMNQTLDHLGTELGQLAVFEVEEHVLSMRGELSVLARARELIHAARTELYLSLWSEELPALHKALLDAAARQVQLHVMLYGEADDLEVRHVYHHAHAAIVRARIGGRLLVLVADGRHVVIARFATGGEVYGCSSQNQALALLAREYLGHDIILESAKDRIEREAWDAWWKSRQDLVEIIVGGALERQTNESHRTTRSEQPDFVARSDADDCTQGGKHRAGS